MSDESEDGYLGAPKSARQYALDKAHAIITERNSMSEQLVLGGKILDAIETIQDFHRRFDTILSDHARLAAANAALVERVKRLEDALRPFAEHAAEVEKFISDRAKDGISPIMHTNKFRLSDFRAARAALDG
jgi:hypothetical protein